MEHVEARQLRQLIRAMVDVGSHLDLPQVLRQIVGTATDLVDARYGALGVLDPTRTHLAQFITVGLDDDEVAVIGDRPKGHGILGLLIVDPNPIRLPDLNVHPDSFGFPPGHPPMSSFLGVPVLVRGEVFGNLYLTDKIGGMPFTDADEELAVGLSAAAGVAIDNARMHQRVREIDLLEDRERIARDLHDTVIQRLFATGLSLQASSRLATDPELNDRIQTAVDDLDTTVREIRTAIFGLHTEHRLPGSSIRRRLLRIGDELVDAIGSEPRFRFDGPVDNSVSSSDEGGDGSTTLADDVAAVCREALTNVAKHAPGPAEVQLSAERGWLELLVTDRGPGPGAAAGSSEAPAASATGHGLRNMRTRAEARGGSSELVETAEGGSVLRWRVPLGGPDR
jgi:signal transduction histidine kinase